MPELTTKAPSVSMDGEAGALGSTNTLSDVDYDPGDRTTAQILRDWGAVMRELRARDIIRTNNNPVGDIAEAIVAEHYRAKRGSFSQAGWDLLTPDGERIQVKAMRQTSSNKRRNLSPIRDQDYDYVVIVVVDEDFVVTEGLRLSREAVEELFPHRDYVNGRVITVTDALRSDPRVERVDLSLAAQRLAPEDNRAGARHGVVHHVHSAGWGLAQSEAFTRAVLAHFPSREWPPSAGAGAT